MKITRLIKVALFKIIPKRIWAFYKINKTMSDSYGYLNSLKAGLPVGINNEPIPWFTYPTIEFIKQLDLKNKRVFEYGSGFSSLFFADKTLEIISVEDNREWFEKVRENKPTNLDLVFKPVKEDYTTYIHKTNKIFDIIIVDASYRLECCHNIKNNLGDDSMVILDNSDWFDDCTAYLRNELKLIQVDFSGFGPINDYTWTTSIFFSRNYDFKPINNQQPKSTIMGQK